MDKLMLIYLFLIVFALIFTIVIFSIVMKQKVKYKINFYNYQIQYDVELEKYYKMIRKQKRVLLKKQMQLLFLNILTKVKGK